MGEGLGPLDGILGLHLRMAHGAVYRHFTDSFADLDLTQMQVSVLWLAGDEPGIAQTGLAKRLQMDRATTMAIVHKLEARGLLLREPAKDDGRRIALRLSDAGQTALKGARAAIATHEAWLKARFSVEESVLLMGLLRRIHG